MEVIIFPLSLLPGVIVSLYIQLFLVPAIAWHEDRRKWLGDQPRTERKINEGKDPIISWSTGYDELQVRLMATNEPFSGPIPLQEMVKFLVDIWQDNASLIRTLSYTAILADSLIKTKPID
ncbi:hypothetical protein SAY86_025269 [Trapa natans]|uniref:Gag1-like clamp domain-containing protein n=1 Tax=Trapa natans TaxID=22666 RepID=A0AAN7M819_TRANT|nr:hypothetical protein SAY86_025269 [Trapa natans]